MKRDQALKERILDVFRHHVFRGRDKETIKNYLSCNFPASHTTVLEEFDDIEVDKLDETADKVTMLWEDYALHMIFRWRIAGNGKDFILMEVE